MKYPNPHSLKRETSRGDLAREDGRRGMLALLVKLSPVRDESLGLGENFVAGCWDAVQEYRRGK